MTESFSYAGLTIALLLPWLAGVVWVRQLLAPTQQWNWPVVVGHGYLLGLLITTVLLRLGNVVGLGIGFAPVAGLLAALCLIGIYMQRHTIGSRPAQDSPPAENWGKIVIYLLLALLGWRYWGLLQELAIRPLYAWDAWMNWSPKALTWYYNGELSEYVAPDQWLQRSPQEAVYTLGNQSAWKYPPTVPLIQLWTMMGTGSHDHNLVFLSWWLLPLALTLAMYGHLRLSGASTVLALVACYLLLSMPYFGVHVALPGYADIWMSATFALALLALHQWQSGEQRAYGILALLLALACTQMKMPGIILGLIVLLVYVRSHLRWSGKREFIVLASAGSLALALFIIGPDITLPGVGRIALTRDTIALPLLGSYQFGFHDVSSAFAQSWFRSINWHLFWPLLIVAFAWRARTGGLGQRPSDLLLACFGGLLFLLFTFYFSNHYAAALNMTTLNRALMYIVPPLLFYLALLVIPYQTPAGQTDG